MSSQTERDLNNALKLIGATVSEYKATGKISEDLLESMGLFVSTFRVLVPQGEEE